MADLTVNFKDPSTIIHLRGQVFHQGNLTQSDFEYLVSFSSGYADFFEPIAAVAAENQVQPKAKKLKDGKDTSSGTSSSSEAESK